MRYVRTRLATALAALALGLGTAQAHNVWLVPDAEGAYLVQFGGHEGKLEEFNSDKLKAVTAYDRRGRKIDVTTHAATDGVRVKPEREPAMLAAEFDNGFFSKREGSPMVNKPMDENPGATSGVHAVKFHKTVLQWGLIARKELGQTFEIVGTESKEPQAGQPLKVQVLKDGKPAAGVRLSIGEDGPPVTSAADGTATVTPVEGRNQLLAIIRMPMQGNPKTTQLSYEYLFAFQTHD
jgi:nickel transport protein